MLRRRDKYFALSILFVFQVVCLNYEQKIAPVCWFQIDMLMSLFDEDSRPLLIPAAFIYFGELLLLFSCLQRQLAFFNLLSLIGIGAMATAILLLGIITKPALVFGTASVFIIMSVVFIIRMWRKADMEKYIVNDHDERR